MIVARSMHPDWRSNAFLVADAAGGSAIFVDAGAPVEPLMAKVAELHVDVSHVLLTHEHHDHTTHLVAIEERYGAMAVLPETSVTGMTVPLGTLTMRSVSTPGHCEPHVAWIVEEGGTPVAVFSGDALLRDTVGGTVGGGRDGLDKLRHSILDVLLALPPETIIYPGHMEQTTVARERADNPFVRAWRGDDVERDEAVQVAGVDATLLLESRDYDGGTKAWVRFADGREAVVGGSMVSRARERA